MDRYCKNGDPCDELKRAADSFLNFAELEINKLKADKHGLYLDAYEYKNPTVTGTNTTWLGHVGKAKSYLQQAEDLIKLGEKLGCDMLNQKIRLWGLFIPAGPDSIKWRF